MEKGRDLSIFREGLREEVRGLYGDMRPIRHTFILESMDLLVVVVGPAGFEPATKAL